MKKKKVGVDTKYEKKSDMNVFLKPQINTIRKDEYLKLKKSRRIRRIVGILLFVFCYPFYPLLISLEMPILVVPFACGLVAGLILFIQSFSSPKYAPLKHARFDDQGKKNNMRQLDKSKKKNNRTTTDATTGISKFDRNAFVKKYNSTIVHRLPDNIEDIETQKYFSNDIPMNTAASANTENSRNSGKYTEGIDYVVQYRSEDDIYFVEIHDMTGNYLADVDWFPGKIGYAAFVLTEDEYNLKMAHNDVAKMNELVGKLLENLPKDRLIDAGCINTANRGQREDLRLDLKNETMDDNAYQKYRNQRAISYINSLDRVFVTFMRVTGDQIPSVDGFGYAWIFSKKEYADIILQKNPGVDMFYKEFDKEGLKTFVKTWYRFGISRFKLNPGTNDRYAEVDRDDFLPIEGIKKWDLIGSSLNQLIIRFKQNNAIQNNPMAHATAMTMWSSICHELYRSVFLVPFTYDDEPYEVEDWVIHAATSLVGAERLTQAEIKRHLGDRAGDARKLVAEDKDGNPIYILNKDLIYGSEKYHFAKDGEVTSGRIMHLGTMLNNGTTFLCGFTDFEALHKVFGENVGVAILSYEDIIAHMNDAVSDSTAIQGFVINPGTNDLILSRENIEYAAKEKDEPGKFYTVDENK